jgi:uncharacterized membrane protein
MDVGLNSGIYKFLLVLHLITVVVGFGSVVLNGVYGARAKKAGGREGVAIAEANTFVSDKVAELFIYAVPIFGILLIWASDGDWGFDQKWISFSFLLYLIGLGLSHGLLRPAVRRMNTLTAQLAAAGPSPSAGGPPPEVAEVEGLEKRIGAIGMALNLIVVVVIALMVWKPF